MGSWFEPLNRLKTKMWGAAGALAAFSVCATPVWADCREDTVFLRGDFGQARFSVDVVDTPDARSQGLMFVEQMPASKGMLFVYETARPVAFWMKNTLIPLDMVFADAQGVVQNVHANAVPGDLTPIPGEGDIQYVLEINGGLAAQLGITAGSEMQHPAIEDAAWACD